MGVTAQSCYKFNPPRVETNSLQWERGAEEESREVWDSWGQQLWDCSTESVMDEVLPGRQTHRRVLAPKAELQALSSSAWSGRKGCGAGWGLGSSWQGKKGRLELERTITLQTY